jgi:hypothetical protein
MLSSTQNIISKAKDIRQLANEKMFETKIKIISLPGNNGPLNSKCIVILCLVTPAL